MKTKSLKNRSSKLSGTKVPAQKTVSVSNFVHKGRILSADDINKNRSSRYTFITF